MTRVVGLLLFGLVACGGKGGGDKVDPKAAEGFARGLAAVSEAEPTRSASLVSQAAYETIAPSMKCMERFGAAATERARIEALFDCGLACTPDAVQKLKGKEPRTWMAELAAACEPAHFGLEKSNAAMLSAEWFLLHKIAELAGPHVAAAEGPVKARLDQAMAGFALPLPLPAVAQEMFELPVAPAEVSAPVATRTYVIVPGTGPLRVGAAPFGRLGARGAAMEAPEGRALFPGNEVAPEDLRAMVLENAGAQALDAGPPPPQPPAAAPPDAGAPPAPRGQYKMKSDRDDSALAKRQAMDKARAAGVLQTIEELDARDRAAGIDHGAPIGLPPGLHGRVTKTLRGDLGRNDQPVVPLLLADGRRPAADVIELAAVLPHVLVAVAAPDDPAARALVVELRSDLNSAGRGPGQAHVALAVGGVEAAKKAAGGSEATVVIRVDGGVLWSEAVAVSAVAIARGAERIVLTSERMDLAGDAGGGLLGHGASGSGKPALSIINEESPTSTGELDPAVIRRVIRSRMAALRACYERELQRNPTLTGRIDLEFTIGADGTVKAAKGTGLAVVSDCAVRQVKAMKFPAPKGGGQVKVRYPLVFQPKGE